MKEKIEKINLNKFDRLKIVNGEKIHPPFDENPYIKALCKYLLENLSAEVAKQKKEKGLINKELIKVKNLTPSIENIHSVSNLLNCTIDNQRKKNPWLVSDANLEIIAKNLNTTPYNLLWENSYTSISSNSPRFKNSHYLKSGHHVNPISLSDFFKIGIDFLLGTDYASLVNKALELYGPYTFAKYFEPDKLKEAKSLAIEFVFEDLKVKFLKNQEEFFKEGSTFKLNKQLREFYENKLVNLLQLYVESAPDFALKLVEVMKGASELAENVRRGKEETERATLPVSEFDEAYSIIENFAVSSESLLKLLVNEQNENMIDQNKTVKSGAKYFGEDKK